ncbi:hypothetical protein M5K25_007592 [Dendrobium thyrsiflorum]|uniref:Uncharacterized protein n=1 Tax=Dendrobium thyrsiflorum TaxID=117978 RepID=A0ABD0VLL7_DENTH
MSSSGGRNEIGDGSSELNIEDNKLSWNYVTKLRNTSEGGGNVAFKYNYYNAIYKRSYYRVKAYLLKIVGHGIKVFQKKSSSEVTELQKKMSEAE